MPIVDVRLSHDVPCKDMNSYPILDQNVYLYNEMRKAGDSCELGSNSNYVMRKFNKNLKFPNDEVGINLYNLHSNNTVINKLEA